MTSNVKTNLVFELFFKKKITFQFVNLADFALR